MFSAGKSFGRYQTRDDCRVGDGTSRTARNVAISCTLHVTDALAIGFRIEMEGGGALTPVETIQ